MPEVLELWEVHTYGNVVATTDYKQASDIYDRHMQAGTPVNLGRAVYTDYRWFDGEEEVYTDRTADNSTQS